jgi:RNA polymerase sigma factor (sigma-70 family)
MKKISFRNDILPLKNQLYRLAQRITLDSAEAEDIVQETLIKIWNRRDTWDEIDNMEAFCFTICRNLSLDSIKKRGNQNESIDQTQIDHPDNALTPSDQTIQRDQVAWVRQIVDSLPEKQRSCIQLRDFEGKTYKDIARILQISEEQVKVNIFRGRQTIKRRFQEIDMLKM